MLKHKFHIFIFPTLCSKFRWICETLFHSLSYTPTCRGFMKVFSLLRARKYAKWKIVSNESMTGVIWKSLVNVSHKCQVCVLFRVWMWQHIGKRKIAFCTIILMCSPFDPLPLTLKGHLLSPTSNFESPLTNSRVKLAPKKQKSISQPSINHPHRA